ncbi:unnamed protein product [Schistosoma curassoni]|uniref:Uncharacterized protein n=1 Tax=Schistosoma curassoni TaxID=6186 RepID=A0A3P8FRF8_9TREM|nr:unnamed protein product [Schistosoma curassoni]
MVVGGSQQETLDPGFVLFGTRQQDVPVILREPVLPGGFDLVSRPISSSEPLKMKSLKYISRKPVIMPRIATLNDLNSHRLGRIIYFMAVSLPC